MAPLNLPLFEKLKSKRLILASTSPRRLEILNQMGITNIEVIAPNFEETLDKINLSTEDYVIETALGKAKSVRQKIQDDANAVIISSDTVVELDGKIYEKPESKITQLTNLQKFRDSDSPLRVLSSVIINFHDEEGNLDITAVEETKVYFDTGSSDELLQAYVDSEDGLNVAAGFKIQSTGGLLIEKIEGDYCNVVGLPMRMTYEMLENAMEIQELKS